ncbi:MAG: alanine racemase [Nannocystaceae bacterium]|nr:alanine racemase [Nannocystaceae bacterium]
MMGAPSARKQHKGTGQAIDGQLRPTYARIDASALGHNLRRVASHVGEHCRVLAVVKADAYGHGAVDAAQTFVAAGAWGLAVSLVEEGVALREAGIGAPIVVLGGVYPGSQDVIVHRRLTPVVWSLDHLTMLAGAVRRTGAQPCPVHLNIDTGMSRLGARPSELPALLDWWVADGGRTLRLEGAMTHLACADDPADDISSARQLALFSEALQGLAARGLKVELRHASNSAGIVRFPEAHLDMVRPGIALYGAAADVKVELPGLRLAMAVCSRVQAVRELPKGSRISYGGTHVLQRDARVAVVPVGYGDGYPCAMSGKAQMLVRGHRCNVLGRITMDVCMLDVTDLPDVCVGERVTVMGRQDGETLGIHELAAWADVIPYEVTCGISKRVPRLYG